MVRTRLFRSLFALALTLAAAPAVAASEYFYSPGSAPFPSGTPFGVRGRVVDVVEVEDEAGAVVRRSLTVNVMSGGISTYHQISMALSALVYDVNNQPVSAPDWFGLAACPNVSASAGGIDGTGESFTFGRLTCPVGERGTCVSVSGSWGTAVYLAEGPRALPVGTALYVRTNCHW